MAKLRDAFAPRGMSAGDWAAIRDLTISLGSAISEIKPNTVRRSMTVLAWYLHYCRTVAFHPMTPEFLLRRDVIGTYIAHLQASKKYSASTLGTYRSHLFRVGDANIAHVQPSGRVPGFRPSDPSAPYRAHEIVALQSWAEWQPTQGLRIDSQLLLALGLGCGLSSAEITNLRAGHITVDDEGVLVRVVQGRERDVPVLAEWEGIVSALASAAWDRDMFLFQPRRTTAGRNVVYNMIHRSTNRPFQINTQRLRATWIVGHLAADVPVQALLDASGIETIGALGRYFAHLAPVDRSEARAALTRRARTEGCTAPYRARKAVEQ